MNPRPINSRIGDSLFYHADQKFSTWDQGNKDCARQSGGAWW